MKPSPSLFFSSVILALTLLIGACDPLGGDDLPKKDWTVESVVYYKNASPPFYHVYWGGETDFDDHQYFYRMNRETSIDFTEIVVLPGVKCTGLEMIFSSGFIGLAESGGTPTGDAVITYDNAYFYEYGGGDDLFDGDWSAEVRIVTKTVPVTVIP
jgi:hypothetical protein